MKMTVLYDGTCSLCKESRRLFEKLDWLDKINWFSLQEYEKTNGETGYNQKELRKEIHLFTGSGKVLKGFYAVRLIMLQCPPAFVPGLLMYFPLVPLIGKPIYKMVAKNRHKFFRRKCDDGSCAL
ncbi:thiol-disulfide oxidoreductase DCC family protein [Cytobacillus gottheilii]|uniref:thiol-disulfide oxidoreductase DCC family protein n=1 Tax=Cytobacillus gottheilii TaxID=859144 RepID=UPI003CE9EEBA